MYKERKETTHIEIDEEDLHHIYIYIYISKIHTMYVKMVTRPVYKKNEVSTPPNKMKHIFPLQRHVFSPHNMLNTIKSILTQTLEKLYKKRWQERL